MKALAKAPVLVPAAVALAAMLAAAPAASAKRPAVFRVGAAGARLHGSVYRLTIVVRGGDPPALAWLWRLGDGRRAAGRSVVRTLTSADARHVSVSVVDASGSVARASRTVGAGG